MPRGVTSVEALAAARMAADHAQRRAAACDARRSRRPAGRELTGEERGRFRMLVGLPPRAGTTLTFKVLQVYDSGEIVRWLGPGGHQRAGADLAAHGGPEAAGRAGPAGE